MWKYGFASVAGTFHLKSSAPCQDASCVEVVVDAGGSQVLLAVASDGAGSAALGQLGSTLACDLFVDEVKSHIEGGNTRALLSDNFIADWVGKFRRTALGWSGAEGVRAQDFACTLLAAVVWHDRAVYFQIGDGAIVESRRDEPDRYTVVCWPQQGEYANMTYFLTVANRTLAQPPSPPPFYPSAPGWAAPEWTPAPGGRGSFAHSILGLDDYSPAPINPPPAQGAQFAPEVARKLCDWCGAETNAENRFCSICGSAFDHWGGTGSVSDPSPEHRRYAGGVSDLGIDQRYGEGSVSDPGIDQRYGTGSVSDLDSDREAS